MVKRCAVDEVTFFSEDFNFEQRDSLLLSDRNVNTNFHNHLLCHPTNRKKKLIQDSLDHEYFSSF